MAVPVFRGGEGKRERELSAETHLVVLIHGQGGVATSTYAIVYNGNHIARHATT